MRVAIAGAGAVGPLDRPRADRATATRSCSSTRTPRAIKPERVPDAEWLLADSCELSSLEEARLDKCDVVIAATGDDKANLVTSLLAKTEFGVPRTVGRVNHPNNEWLFTEAWGVDVNVSTPRIMSALVEEAVTVGDLVRLFTFRQGNANLVEMTLPADSPYVGKPSRADPVPRELRAGDDPARRAGLHARRRAAGRGRRRAAVRRAGRRRGRARAAARARHATAAEAATASGSARLGLARACGCAPSSHTIAPSAASWSGQPSAILSTPERGDRGVGVDRRRTLPASQIGAWTATRTHARQRPAARSAACTAGRPACRACQAVGSPVTLPTMKPTSGQPIRQVNASTHGVAGVVEDPGQEVGQRLVVGAAARRAPTAVTNSQPMPMPTSALTHELHGRALHEPDHEQHQRGARR